ncbi:phage tail protein [cf. Phormidesmis sp. LEGE 11477]|uniref:phage tail protein n=1 Tax=cf. Phormidesmis sp. LEGE 11477 TaxID=1828680 RepID=UPI0018817B04|nr:phage tail protein [cf. Phormidesmis sp. LEGE 11477]MBE9062415.1 phage tail protein [cf. Phormidesmis sp. LEGE 11477]
MPDLQPITTSRFYVEFDGLSEKMLKSVQEVTFQGQVSGGEKPLMSTKSGKTLRQSTSTGFEENPNITIEIYLMENDMDFYNWFQAAMPASYSGAGSGDGKWADNRKNGAIVAYDPGDNEIMRWEIKNGWLKSYKMSDFAADGTELAYETYEIVCEDLKRVN